MKKKSLFGKITSAFSDSDDDVESYGYEIETTYDDSPSTPPRKESAVMEGKLAVDLCDIGNAIVLQTLIPGVRPEDIEITLARSYVHLRGFRQNQYDSADTLYTFQELFWGSFSREIPLPDEIDIDRAEATEDHGLLTIKMPKIDKERINRVIIGR